MAAPDTGLARLFNPRSVSLVGATDRSTWSKMAFDNLKLQLFGTPHHREAGSRLDRQGR